MTPDFFNSGFFCIFTLSINLDGTVRNKEAGGILRPARYFARLLITMLITFVEKNSQKVFYCQELLLYLQHQINNKHHDNIRNQSRNR